MSCPYGDELLEHWDGVANPMGNECFTCEEWDCEHNENCDNPEWVDIGEYARMFREGR